jgi:predicted acetyltransferase
MDVEQFAPSASAALPAPRLALPDPALRPSFLEAMAEFAAEGRGRADDDSMIGYEIRTFGAKWSSPDGFAEYLARLRADARADSVRPGRVPSSTWWWVQGDTYLGRIAVRHRLNEWLLEVGGNIGYDVRPSARRRGHATAMLQAVLPEAKLLGIDPALLTCDVGNVASRKVIEHAGGVLEDERVGKLRFWVPTGA